MQPGNFSSNVWDMSSQDKKYPHKCLKHSALTERKMQRSIVTKHKTAQLGEGLGGGQSDSFPPTSDTATQAILSQPVSFLCSFLRTWPFCCYSWDECHMWQQNLAILLQEKMWLCSRTGGEGASTICNCCWAVAVTGDRTLLTDLSWKDVN